MHVLWGLLCKVQPHECHRGHTSPRVARNPCARTIAVAIMRYLSPPACWRRSSYNPTGVVARRGRAPTRSLKARRGRQHDISCRRIVQMHRLPMLCPGARRCHLTCRRATTAFQSEHRKCYTGRGERALQAYKPSEPMTPDFNAPSRHLRGNMHVANSVPIASLCCSLLHCTSHGAWPASLRLQLTVHHVHAQSASYRAPWREA